jgi:hypothetical protein
MALSNFAVVRDTNASQLFGDPLIHCHDGAQLILAFVSRQALNDYFQVPGDLRRALDEWNLIIERNLQAFTRIIMAKYERDDYQTHDAYGQTYPRLVITLKDIENNGEYIAAEPRSGSTVG